MKERCLSVVIPVYNEEDTLAAIVERVLALPQVLEIVVVDDGSTDKTPEILKNLSTKHSEIQAVRHHTNLGKTAALRSGVCLTQGEVVIVQDADLEYSPEEIPQVIAPILNGQADVVFGSRFLARKTSKFMYLSNYICNRLLTLLSNLSSNLSLTDVMTCYIAFRADIIRQMRIGSHGFGFEVEVVAKVAKLNCAICETPISYQGRTYDSGKKITVWDGVAATYYIVRYNLFCSLNASFHRIPRSGCKGIS